VDTEPPALLAPAPPPPPTLGVAATDFYGRDAHEKDLCESASKPDWLYLGIQPLLVAGAIALDTQVFKYEAFADGTGGSVVRDFGPALVGATWGMFVGSFVPSLPKCSTHFVTTVPPEGQVRTQWPIAIAMAAFAGVTAPIVDYLSIGSTPTNWTDGERVSRIFVASTFAIGFALFPYLVAPKPLRAMRELYKIRASVTPQASFVSYTIQF